MTEPAEPEWVDQKTAAARLSISTRTLRTWTRNGVVPLYTFPGDIRRYRVEDLDALAQPRRAG